MSRHVSRLFAAFLFLFLAAGSAAAQVAQEALDLGVVERIREEGLERSQLEGLAHHLTDVIGPRLTGSPGMQAAHDWTASMLREWGLENVQIEPWGEFGRGWERVFYSGQILSPYAQPLHAQPVAWTGSTGGPVSGIAVIVEAETPEDLGQYRGQLKGAFLLLREPPEVGPEFEFEDRRFDADDLLAPAEAEERGGPPEQRQRMRERYRRLREMQSAVASLAAQEGAAAILRPSDRTHGVLRAAGGDRSGIEPGTPEPLPQLVVSAEQYSQIYRNVASGVPVRLQLEVENRFYEDDTRAYNTLGDLPGSDLAGEYVMIGAHLDSWHMGTGAVDNAAGSVVMMEAMRILKALNVKPRRTIRIGLWSGEEQGFLGSRGWLAKHPELHERISAYLNVDNGTGKIRGIWDQSNEAAIPIFEQILWPFRDLGVVAVRHGDTGGTDHLAFDEAGIPGFNFIQDPLEYDFRNHHTYLDTFDHMLLDDLRQAAVVVAATAYHLAMRDEPMPRKVGRPVTQ